MSKNKIAGLSQALTEQMKERFVPDSNNPNNSDSTNTSIAPIHHSTIDSNSTKVRKNFYIEKHLVQLLRKAAYEEGSDQTKIINTALETYLKEHGYA